MGQLPLHGGSVSLLCAAHSLGLAGKVVSGCLEGGKWQEILRSGAVSCCRPGKGGVIWLHRQSWKEQFSLPLCLMRGAPTVAYCVGIRIPALLGCWGRIDCKVLLADRRLAAK